MVLIPTLIVIHKMDSARVNRAIEEKTALNVYRAYSRTVGQEVECFVIRTFYEKLDDMEISY